MADAECDGDVVGDGEEETLGVDDVLSDALAVCDDDAVSDGVLVLLSDVVTDCETDDDTDCDALSVAVMVSDLLWLMESDSVGVKSGVNDPWNDVVSDGVPPVHV